MNKEEYNSKIEKSLKDINLDGFRDKMLAPLRKCEISEEDVEDGYKVHCSKSFFPLRCHEKAFDYLNLLCQKDNNLLEDVKLVQGAIWRFENGVFPDEHSWIEIDHKIVFDGVLQKFYNRNCYRNVKCRAKPYEYTIQQAFQFYEKYGAVYFPSIDK
jgi:hypothetical protein